MQLVHHRIGPAVLQAGAYAEILRLEHQDSTREAAWVDLASPRKFGQFTGSGPRTENQVIEQWRRESHLGTLGNWAEMEERKHLVLQHTSGVLACASTQPEFNK